MSNSLLVLIMGYLAVGILSASSYNKFTHGDTWAMVKKYKWEFIFNTIVWPRIVVRWFR